MIRTISLNKKPTTSNTKPLGGRQFSLILCCVLAVLCLPSAARAKKFEIIALPDTENYVDPPSNAWVMVAQTKWIVAQKKAKNIVFVTQLGDLLHYKPKTEILLANAAFDLLNGVVPYSVSQGNHDKSKQFENHYGEARYKKYDWYGGSFQTNNHYQIFPAEGYKFLHLNLQKGPNADVLAWAQKVIDANPGKPTIITTHDYLDNKNKIVTRTGAGKDIWNGLVKKNRQIFMTISAHKHHTPASAHLLSDNDAGDPVLQILADFEDYKGPSGKTDSGYLSRIIFDTAAKTISVKTFSPTYKKRPYLTDKDHQYSFAAEFLKQKKGVARPIGVVAKPAKKSPTAIDKPATVSPIAIVGLATISVLAIGGPVLLVRRKRA